MRSDELQSIHIATLNIKFDPNANNPVPIPDKGSIPPHRHYPWSDLYAENPWAERRSRIVDALLATGQLDIVGFQEVLHNQLLDLSALLGPGYGLVGVGRDDGKERGEYAPIFWNKDKFELVRWKTIWLSPTPDQPGSKGWDAGLTRIATIATLSATSGGKEELVHVVNTHYDDRGVKARAESSLIIRDHVKQWVERFEDPNGPDKAGPAPVILIGDFNSPDNEDGYKNITSSDPLPNHARSFTFLDSFTHLQDRATISAAAAVAPSRARQSNVYGPLKTYTGFTRPGKTATTRIDFIMLASARDPNTQDGDDNKIRGGWHVTRYGCIDNWVEEGDVDGWTGRWSDHRAVRVTVERV